MREEGLPLTGKRPDFLPTEHHDIFAQTGFADVETKHKAVKNRILATGRRK